MSDHTHSNDLGHETSPYLLQHAHNPVAWYPWDAQALTRARAEHKPILLSIGYSACHWCHVMAHESFEDADTAALMNRLYVNIKVDREERPDLDRVYQLAHQILAQRSGGWPLTVFLDPEDLIPFFAGTYFPKEPRYGMPSFREVLTRVAEFHRDHQDDLHRQNAALRDVFLRIAAETTGSAGELHQAPLDTACRSLAESFDPRCGGFGGAPKFPQVPALEFLLHRATDAAADAGMREQSRRMLAVTLTHMAEGGIYDQLGGGFCRYSVDAEWAIPHFEKMLYDNGPLLALYAQAWKLTGDPLFRTVAEETAGWVLREMRSPEGGFYSSLDADSEGHEGKYYAWDLQEVRRLLTPDEYAAFAPRYGLDRPPNFEGRWHLAVRKTLAAVAGETGVSGDAVRARIESARGKLLAARAQRVHPGLDDKILTAWNGLMIGGLSTAGRLLGREDWMDAAACAAKFLHEHLWRDGRLLASWRAGQARFPAYLDDHAFLLSGLIELLQARWDSGLFAFARELADVMLAHFEDKPRGGFWFTADDQPTPLQRPKSGGDESMASGNAVAARTLLTLGHLCAEPRYIEVAERALKAAMPLLSRYPNGHMATLTALSDALRPPVLVILRGKEADMRAWRDAVEQCFDPRRRILAVSPQATGLTGFLRQCAPRDATCAYVCRGPACSLPLASVRALAACLTEDTPSTSTP
ncbi:MAG: thioredoxin domain-containing protein [Gammaproteobacteria bacterium]|nr:thioredoxin domain-containing protein [Gammaproteobacteria bacterium]